MINQIRLFLFRYTKPEINRLVSLMKSPVSAILTILGILYFLGFIVGLSIVFRVEPITETIELSSSDKISAVITVLTIFVIYLILGLSNLFSSVSVYGGDFNYLFLMPLKSRNIILFQMVRNILLMIGLTAILLHVIIPPLPIKNILLAKMTIYNFVLFCSLANFLSYFAIIKFKLEKFFKITFSIFSVVFFGTMLTSALKPELLGVDFVSIFSSRFWNWLPIFNWYRSGLLAIFSNEVSYGVIVYQFLTNLLFGVLIYILADDYFENLILSWNCFQERSQNSQNLIFTAISKKSKIGKITPKFGYKSFYWKSVVEKKKSVYYWLINLRSLMYPLIGYYLTKGKSFEFVLFQVAIIVIFEVFIFMKRFNEFNMPYIYYFPGSLKQKYWATFKVQIIAFLFNTMLCFGVILIRKPGHYKSIIANYLHVICLFFFLHSFFLVLAKYISKGKLKQFMIAFTSILFYLFMGLAILLQIVSLKIFGNVYFGTICIDVLMLLIMATIYPDTEKYLSKLEL